MLGYEASRTCASAPTASSRTCTRRRRTSTAPAQGGTVPPGVDTVADRALRTGRRSAAGTRRAGTTIASTGWARRLPPSVAASPGTFHHLSQQNIVFLRNGETRRDRGRARLGARPERAPVDTRPGGPVRGRPRRCARCPGGGGCSPCSSACSSCADIAHAIGFEIPRPGTNRRKARPVPRRQLRVDRGVDRRGADDHCARAPAGGGVVRRGLRRAPHRARRRGDRPLDAVEVAAARRGSGVARRGWRSSSRSGSAAGSSSARSSA